MQSITPQELLDRFDRIWRECQRYYRVAELPMPDQLELKFGSIRKDLVNSLGLQEGPKVTKSEALKKIQEQLQLVDGLSVDDPNFAIQSHRLEQMLTLFSQMYKLNAEDLLREQQEKERKKKLQPSLLTGSELST